MLDNSSDQAGDAVNTTSAARLAELIRPVSGSLRAAAALQVVASVAAIAPLALIGMIGSDLLEERPPGGGLVAAVAGALILRVLAEAAALAISHDADVRLQHHLRWRIVDVLSRVPLRWFSATPSGTVRRAVNDDVAELHFLVAHAKVEQVAGVVTPIAGLVWCALLDWRLAIVAALPLVAYGLLSWIAMRSAGSVMEEIAAALGRMSAAITEFVHGIAVVKVFGTRRTAHDRFIRAAEDYQDTYGAWARTLTRGSALAGVLLSAPVILLLTLGFGFWFIGAGWCHPVEVIAAALIAMVIPSTVVSLGFSAQFRRQAEAAAERITDILDIPGLPAAAEEVELTGTDVELADVDYAYSNGDLAVKGISLDFPAGTTTALVGASGAGKSTLAGLVARFDDPTRGQVRIGGVDVREIPPRQLYDTVSFVLQDTGLVGISIADNIRLGRPRASDDEVVEAARRAQVAEDIFALPEGFDTLVTSDHGLSGGQQQRIAVARAILRDAPIVVLDEATSFADPDSEARVQAALDELTEEATVILIAHRLRTVVDCDRIVVLDGGEVAEVGTHDELLEMRGIYADLWQRSTIGREEGIR
ncbi:ABC transporter ATP-binding protein/permease [Corynebacterium sp. TAE3-ERU12]|uniref:ABC transporter ATP-binding protein n=1 Tax=Corynebacterium sp. TAE3-ERU12 TaxID=2849491 RepID=UPI001C48716C|nr:ABC transporter ATP-binding protein [Corynebacterium sp. TAE3-ERU12]MBV7294661.1 ABC transporter ATP-binding protein/permease [Corynebacterium sp. TAE3-ERU12]